MPTVNLSNNLKGRIGSVIFEEMCIENSFAWIKLEDIYKNFTPDNLLTFKYKFQRIQVKIPNSISREIWAVCRPTNGKQKSPSFLCDYLTLKFNSTFFEIVKNGCETNYKLINSHKSLDRHLFSWIEIKSNNATLTKNQRKFFENDGAIGKMVYNVNYSINENSFELNRKISMSQVTDDKLDEIQRTILDEIENQY